MSCRFKALLFALLLFGTNAFASQAFAMFGGWDIFTPGGGRIRSLDDGTSERHLFDSENQPIIYCLIWWRYLDGVIAGEADSGCNHGETLFAYDERTHVLKFFSDTEALRISQSLGTGLHNREVFSLAVRLRLYLLLPMLLVAKIYLVGWSRLNALYELFLNRKLMVLVFFWSSTVLIASLLPSIEIEVAFLPHIRSPEISKILISLALLLILMRQAVTFVKGKIPQLIGENRPRNDILNASLIILSVFIISGWWNVYILEILSENPYLGKIP